MTRRPKITRSIRSVVSGALVLFARVALAQPAPDAGAHAERRPRVTGCTDLNGDGLSDIVVAAPSRHPRGHLYVYLGARTGVDARAPSQTVLAPRDARSAFGEVVRYTGDLNRDGFCDVVALSDERLNETLRAHVLFGGPTGLRDPTRLRGVALPSGTTRVFAAGDTDGDGFDDLVVATGEARSSRLSVLHGAATAEGFRVEAVTSPPPGLTDLTWRAYRRALADVNGDGIADAVEVRDERVIVQPGVAAGSAPSRAWRRRVELIDDLVAVGDFDGDGFDDVVVGREGPFSQPDRTFVLRGSASGLLAPRGLRSRYGETAP